MFCQQEGISYRNKYMTRYMLHAMGYTQMAFMHPHLLVTNTIFLWFLRKMLLKYVATRMHLVMNLFCYIIRILIVMNVGSRNKKKKEWEIESKRSLKKFFNLSMFQSVQHTQKTNFDFCIQWRTFFLFFLTTLLIPLLLYCSQTNDVNLLDTLTALSFLLLEESPKNSLRWSSTSALLSLLPLHTCIHHGVNCELTNTFIFCTVWYLPTKQMTTIIP